MQNDDIEKCLNLKGDNIAAINWKIRTKLKHYLVNVEGPQLYFTLIYMYQINAGIFGWKLVIIVMNYVRVIIYIHVSGLGVVFGLFVQI